MWYRACAAKLAILKLNCIFLTVVVTTSQAIQWTRLRLHTSYLFHNSCCSNIPMRNNQDNTVVRKILANIISNHSRVEEEVETVTISECIGVVTVVTLVCSFLRQRKTRTLNLPCSSWRQDWQHSAYLTAIAGPPPAPAKLAVCSVR